MDQDGHVQPCAGGPDRIQLGIVELQPAAIGPAQAQAEVLEDLQPLGARLDVSLELGGGLRAKTWPDTFTRKVDVGEQHHAIRILAGANRLEASPQPIP